MSTFSGRIALVTGASRGIGKAIAIALAHAGADVAVNFHSQSAAADAVCKEIQSLGRKCIAVQADVSQSPDIDRLVTAVENDLGPITILVNNAGIARLLPAEQVTEEIWNEFRSEEHTSE